MFLTVNQKTILEGLTIQKYGPYYINGYAALFSIVTGVRVGELCSLKRNDIHEISIHIHTQQLFERESGGKSYYLFVPKTKRGNQRMEENSL